MSVYLSIDLSSTSVSLVYACVYIYMYNNTCGSHVCGCSRPEQLDLESLLSCISDGQEEA